MTLQDLIIQFRRSVADEDAPYLWDDDEVLLYLIDAQDQFVRYMGGISDNSTAAITDIAVTANTPTSSFSPYILRIRSGKLLTTKRDIEFLSEADVTTKRIQDYGWRLNNYLDDTDTGDVRWGVLGLEDHKIRWVKVPNASETCRLHVYRLPYPRIADQEDTLEIDEQHHLHLLMWVKHMAYSKQDAEVYDSQAAERCRKTFVEYCERAKAEKDRQRFKPRVVHYGGI